MADSAVATLADLVQVLDAEVIEHPRGLNVPIGDVVVVDQRDLGVGDLVIPTDGVVLLIGAFSDSVDTPIRDTLPELMFGALIVRSELSPAVREFALAAGAAVLRVRVPTNWNDILQRITRIRRTGTAHGEFSTTGSLDLFGIADAAASIAGGPVTVEDTLHRILAYSADQSDSDHLRIQTLLHRRTPIDVIERLRNDGMMRKLAAAPEPMLLEDIAAGVRPRLVMSVRSEDEVLGFLWAALPHNAATPSAEVLAAFVRCADRAATHLVELGGVLGRVRRIEVEHLARLLHGSDESTALPEGVHWVIAVSVDLPPDRRTHAKSRVVHLLDRARLTADIHLIVGDLNDLLYVVVSSRTVQAAAVHQIAGAFDTITGVCAGVSSPAASRHDLPAARLQAERALSVARRDATNKHVAVFDEVWPTGILLRLADSQLAAEILGSGPVRQLAAADRQNGTDYVKTLREYLLAGSDSRSAAERLNVHVNTVRYRLAKLRDEVALDLENPMERLVITLQLTLLGLR